MKKAEATSILATSVRPREPKDRARYDEAVRMAIEALKCSETPKSSDCISRQAAIEALDKRFDNVPMEQTAEILKLRKDLRELPPAQPEDVVGIINNSIDNALTLLGSIHSSGRMMYYSDYCALHDAISSISVQPDHVADIGKKVEWIPCSEKLPEKGSYLVWMPFAPPEYRIAVAEYCDGHWNIKTPISAWMPLPEPYRGGEK